MSRPSLIQFNFTKLNESSFQGSIADVQYPAPCPDIALKSHVIHHEGDVTHINDDIGLHRVKATDEEDVVTLHVYSPPITESRIFEQNGLTSRRKPGFYSKYGKKV